MNEHENMTKEKSQETLIEQNNKIKERWKEIFKKEDDLLPEVPQLRTVLGNDEFNAYLKEITKFKNKIDSKERTNIFYEYKDRYDNIKNKYANNKPVKEAKKIWYIIILGFLAILEVPVNYNSIDNFLHKPLISLFGAISLGIFLMFLSHFIGKFLKQFKFIMQIPNSENNLDFPSRNIEIIKFILSLVGFSLFFFILYEIRTKYYQSILGINSDMQMIEVGIITIKVLINMFINFILFIVGAIVSYIFHDSIPSYQETHYKMKQQLRKIKKYYNSLIKELNRITH